MPEFTYTALTQQGKQSHGNITAETKEEAVAKIKSLDLLPTKVEAATALNRDLNFSAFEQKPKPKEMSVFCKQMVSVLGAGVPMAEALDMLAESTENKMLASSIRGCKQKISGGMSMHEAMQEYKPFQGIFAMMISAGESSGNLEMAFERMSERFEKDDKLKAMIKKASSYPLILAIVAVVVVVIMMLFIVPKFEDLLGQLGGEMPGITKMIIAISDFLQQNFLYVAIAVAVFVIGIKKFKKTDKGMHLFGTLAMKIPLFGKLTVRNACSNTARTMATLLAAGMPMLEAIEITANIMPNICFKDALLEVKKVVAVGTRLSTALQLTGLYPSMLCNMTKIGEETGDLVMMFDKCANYFDDEVQQTTEQVTAAIEPMVIVFMAGIVGTIVIALMLPMLNMYSSLDSM